MITRSSPYRKYVVNNVEEDHVHDIARDASREVKGRYVDKNRFPGYTRFGRIESTIATIASILLGIRFLSPD